MTLLAKPLTRFADFGPMLTYAEAVKSDTAIRRGINNSPTPAQYQNMVRTHNGLYVPICIEFGKITVTSFFRSKALNKAVKGSLTSAHMDGLAIDIDADGMPGVSNTDVYNWCRQNRKRLGYDQLITEFPDKNGKPSWIHIAYRLNGYQRQMAMRAEKRGDEVLYIYE